MKRQKIEGDQLPIDELLPDALASQVAFKNSVYFKPCKSW